LYYSLDAAKESGCPVLAGTINYLEKFLSQPHFKLQEVGHNGSVCPFTRNVLINKTVYFAREMVNMFDKNASDTIRQSLNKLHMQTFLTIDTSLVGESIRKLACLIVLVHGPESAEECNRYVSIVQKEVQPDFVAKGLLLSELHPYSHVPSARNPNFFPSRPPFPIFFIRRIIPNDIPYLLRKDRYDDLTYKKILDSLLRDFGKGVIIKEMVRLGKEVSFPSECPFNRRAL